jgi:hypothetical protein
MSCMDEFNASGYSHDQFGAFQDGWNAAMKVKAIQYDESCLDEGIITEDSRKPLIIDRKPRPLTRDNLCPVCGSEKKSEMGALRCPKNCDLPIMSIET